MKIGDIVMVPCQIVDIGTLPYSKMGAVVLSPIERSSGKPYDNNVVQVFSVLADDVYVLDKGKEEDANN